MDDSNKKLNKKIIYKTNTPYFKYVSPTIYLIATIKAYFLHANIFVVGLLGFFALTSSFQDYLTIVIYKDSFNITYRNCFGEFLAIDNIFYFKDIISFKYDTIKFKPDAKQLALMIVVNSTISGGRYRLFKDPITYVTITTKNPIGEIKIFDLEVRFSGQTYTDALQLINKMCLPKEK